MKINGPNTLYIAEYNNKRYYLFGDIHASTKNICQDKCEDIIPDTFEIINQNLECYEITRFIDII